MKRSIRVCFVLSFWCTWGLNGEMDANFEQELATRVQALRSAQQQHGYLPSAEEPKPAELENVARKMLADTTVDTRFFAGMYEKMHKWADVYKDDFLHAALEHEPPLLEIIQFLRRKGAQFSIDDVETVFEKLIASYALSPENKLTLLQDKTAQDYKKLVDLMLGEKAVYSYDELGQLAFPKSALNKAFGKYGITPLGFAIMTGDVPLVRTLLSYGADVKIPSAGNPPLIWALKEDNRIIADLLIEQGADPNTLDITGQSVLMVAASRGMLDIVNLLLTKGASVKYIVPRTRTTVLMAAVQSNDPDVLAAVYDARLTGIKAVLEKTYEKVLSEKLMEENAQAMVNEVNYAGETAACIAAELGRTEALKFLASKKANFNTSSTYGVPLALAHDVVTAKELVKYDADPLLVNISAIHDDKLLNYIITLRAQVRESAMKKAQSLEDAIDAFADTIKGKVSWSLRIKRALTQFLKFFTGGTAPLMARIETLIQFAGEMKIEAYDTEWDAFAALRGKILREGRPVVRDLALAHSLTGPNKHTQLEVAAFDGLVKKLEAMKQIEVI